MKKILRYTFRTLAILFVLILLIFSGGWFYFKQHKKEVIAFIQSEAKKGLNGGEIRIGDINISIIHTFPRIAFTIDSLSLRDSLWKEHHHDLVKADRAYATLNFFKLITGKISIGLIQLEKPHIYLYTDSSGYTNTSLFEKKGPPKKVSARNPDYPDLEINGGSMVVDKSENHKFFGYDINHLYSKIHSSDENQALNFDVDLDCRVQRMTFNPDKGPYLENKTVTGEFQIQFNTASKILQFQKIRMVVDQQSFIFTGKFFLAEVPTPFILSWETDNLSFRKAASFLAKNIRLELEAYDISETITHLTGSLDNSEPEFSTPLIHLRLNVEDKTIATPVAIFDHAGFVATFNNEEVKGKGHEDSNTVMHYTAFKSTWNKMDFKCDSIVIRDLIHPRMNIHVLSNFRLEQLNNLLDDNTLVFNSGSGKINLAYSGSLETSYDSLRMLNGNFNLDSATITYPPRNLLMTNGKGIIRFNHKDMFIDHLSLKTGSTDLLMDGSVKSLFYLINQKNKKLALDWNINSNKINLNDFTSYLKKKSVRSPVKKKKTMLAQSVTEITNLLETANINLNLNAKQLIYKKFYADNLVANLELDENTLNLKDIKLQAAEGRIGVKGILRNEVSSNPFTVKSQLRNVNVSKIFAGFNNFNLHSPTEKNLGGTLTADINLTGEVTTRAQLVQDALKGTILFNLHNGQLIDFEPVQKIQETVFKSRNFSDIQFADLNDLLEINGQQITINRMEINSTVLHMFVEGMYNMKSGPDLSVQVPLSNLKANKDSVITNKGVNSKTGVSARLRLKRGDDGKIKISWDPFNKAGKEKKKKKQKP